MLFFFFFLDQVACIPTLFHFPFFLLIFVGSKKRSKFCLISSVIYIYKTVVFVCVLTPHQLGAYPGAFIRPSSDHDPPPPPPPPPPKIEIILLCICLKIGLSRETFSSENNKSVRLILWKALQSGRALFRWEDYYNVSFFIDQIPDPQIIQIT